LRDSATFVLFAAVLFGVVSPTAKKIRPSAVTLARPGLAQRSFDGVEIGADAPAWPGRPPACAVAEVKATQVVELRPLGRVVLALLGHGE